MDLHSNNLYQDSNPDQRICSKVLLSIRIVGQNWMAMNS